MFLILLFSCRYLNKAVTNAAIFNFMDIIKENSDELAESYFERIAQRMTSATSTFTCVKIGHRYFKERKVTSKDALPIFADKLQERFSLL